MTWDKNKPAGSQKIRLSDDEIRANWAALEDALGRDHNFPGTEGVDAGEHNCVTLRERSSKPAVDTDKHALYAKADGVYIEKEDETEIKIFDFSTDKLVVDPPRVDIPSGEIILFEKDTVVAGYTLLTDKDDMVIYVTKGSVAGGETGATDKSGGTWQQPDHTLTIDEIPSHKHVVPWGEIGGAPWGTYGSNQQGSGYTDYDNPWYYTSPVGGNQPHDHGNTWRPPGRNFTRQQRN